MKTDKLKTILDNHGKWWRGDGGERANLFGADLSRADLTGAYLIEANLSGADLTRAYLTRANLTRANLSGADLSGATLPPFQICDGTLRAWKKGVDDCLIYLLIPAGAKRTASLVGRKCRAEYAVVKAIYDGDGNSIDSCYGWYDEEFIYTVGATVKPDEYDDDIRVECAQGIHFFQTKEEAEDW